MWKATCPCSCANTAGRHSQVSGGISYTHDKNYTQVLTKTLTVNYPQSYRLTGGGGAHTAHGKSRLHGSSVFAQT